MSHLELIEELTNAPIILPVNDREYLARRIADVLGSRMAHFNNSDRALWGDVGAALNLVLARLGEISYELRRTKKGCVFIMDGRSIQMDRFGRGDAQTEARAILIGLLRFLEGV